MTTERGETPKSDVALAEVNCADGPWVIWNFWSIIFRKITWYFGSFNIWTLVSFQTPLLGESFLAKDAQLPIRSSFLNKGENFIWPVEGRFFTIQLIQLFWQSCFKYAKL